MQFAHLVCNDYQETKEFPESQPKYSPEPVSLRAILAPQSNHVSRLQTLASNPSLIHTSSFSLFLHFFCPSHSFPTRKSDRHLSRYVLDQGINLSYFTPSLLTVWQTSNLNCQLKAPLARSFLISESSSNLQSWNSWWQTSLPGLHLPFTLPLHSDSW